MFTATAVIWAVIFITIQYFYFSIKRFSNRESGYIKPIGSGIVLFTFVSFGFLFLGFMLFRDVYQEWPDLVDVRLYFISGHFGIICVLTFAMPFTTNRFAKSTRLSLNTRILGTILFIFLELVLLSFVGPVLQELCHTCAPFIL